MPRISIHAPHEGERFVYHLFKVLNCISIHAPHEGERPLRPLMQQEVAQHFNPRSPRGGATPIALWVIAWQRLFQSTLPTRGSDALLSATQIARLPFQSTLPTRGSDITKIEYIIDVRISIHAPHEGERPEQNHKGEHNNKHFNPRSPRGGATRKSAFVCSISANLLNIIHCGTVTRAVSRRRIALFRLFSVRRSGVFMYACASH